MKHLTIKEKAEARKMGRRFCGWFERPNGVPYRAYFNSTEEMEQFVDKAHEAGCKFTGYEAI